MIVLVVVGVMKCCQRFGAKTGTKEQKCCTWKTNMPLARRQGVASERQVCSEKLQRSRALRKFTGELPQVAEWAVQHLRTQGKSFRQLLEFLCSAALRRLGFAAAVVLSGGNAVRSSRPFVQSTNENRSIQDKSHQALKSIPYHATAPYPIPSIN